MTQIQSAKTVVAIIGKEGVGKSQLATSLTGKSAYSSNFRGSTVHCETYDTQNFTFVDTPGIERNSDSTTTTMALMQLAQRDIVLLVAQATHIDSDLEDLLPLVQGKRGAVVVTHWDRVTMTNRDAKLENLSRVCGLEFVPVDARWLDMDEKKRIMANLAVPSQFPEKLAVRVGWSIEPKSTVLEYKYTGQIIAAILILFPSIASVLVANAFAGIVEMPVKDLIVPAVEVMYLLPSPLADVLVGGHGFVTMSPLLFVWAVPTIVIYSILLGAYKASGLLERISAAMHPLLRPRPERTRSGASDNGLWLQRTCSALYTLMFLVF